MILDAAYKPVKKALDAVEKKLLAPDSLEELASFLGTAAAGGRRVNTLEVKNYIVASGGKRIRAAITLLSATLCGGKPERAIPLAAAIELFHAASLVIDDLLADADMRRSKTTPHRKWSESAALEAAVGLQLRAAPIFLDAVKNAHDPFDLVEITGRAMLRVPTGALDQHRQKMNLSLLEKDYLKTISDKTAALFELAAEGGAATVGAIPEMRKALRSYGARLGLAFQIRDDVLDVTGDKKRLGKAPGSDFREGKITLPMIRFVSESSPSEIKKMNSLLKSKNVKAWEEAALLMNAKGSIGYAAERGSRESEKAAKAISVFPKSDARRSLETIAFIASERKA